MEQITQEVIDEARKALKDDNYTEFFEAFGFKVYGDCHIGNVKEPNGIELESYTDSGGDMIITIEVNDDWKREFKSYVEDFSIDEEVSLWWKDGEDKAHEGGVPFSNIREHYEDLEEWVAWLKDIVLVMEGKEPLSEEQDMTEELDAVKKWVYWSFNYFAPEKFIRDIWGDGPFADHIMDKFIKYGNMNRFYCELDKENQEKLARYVLTNYSCK